MYAPFHQFPAQDMGILKHFTPGDYPVVHATVANATADKSLALWSFKQDTTSIVMRGVVQLLGAESWPRCVLYDDADCVRFPDSRLPLPLVFKMIDEFVDRVRRHRSVQDVPQRSRRQGQLALRITSRWIDRLNHKILPSLFLTDIKRNGQVVYMELPRDAEQLVCGPHWPQFHSCQTLWARVPNTKDTQASEHGLKVILRRLHALRRAYPNATLETVVLEGADDFTRGSFVYLGRSYRDLVLFTRVRSCEPQRNASGADSVCETLAIDDYRFEDGRMATSVLDWSALISLLRALGQLYMWLRMLLLFFGAFFACGDPTLSLVDRVMSSEHWQLTLHTFFLIPSQVVVYGSFLPISLYVLPHIMDCLAIQEVIFVHNSSVMGLYILSFKQVFSIGMVSLRCIWLLMWCCHVLARVLVLRPWSPQDGVLGMPEFFVNVACMSVVLAQMRVRKWRSTENTEVMEVPASAAFAQVRSVQLQMRSTTLSQLLVGSVMDLQFILTSLLVIGAIVAVFRGLRALLPRAIRFWPVMVTRTYTPFSAHALWPTDSLVVSWYGSIITGSNTSSTASPRAKRRKRETKVDVRPVKVAQRRKLSFSGWRRFVTDTIDSAVSTRDDHRLLSQGMLLDRDSHDESLIFLINLTAMTDPVTFLRLRFANDVWLGIFETKRSKQVVVLRMALMEAPGNIDIEWSDLRLVKLQRSSELSWVDLLHCR
ncbi:hypothetical protein PINS_up005591 [Pythium insidiosum]|nr:hypothetical protein PINS_up005591 [Pythium insidiosum]